MPIIFRLRQSYDNSAISHSPAADSGAHLLDNTRKFMAESKLLREAFITALVQKSVEIRTTDAAMTHRQQNFAGSGRGHRHILNFGGARGSTQSSKGFHGRSKLVPARRVKRKYKP
jgi:hypothetical protein